VRSFRPALRTAFRSLVKSPGYASATVLILALGVGANAAIFSIVRTTLLGDLPFPDGDRIVQIWETQAGSEGQSSVSLPDFLDLRAQADSFESTAALWFGNRNLQSGGEPERIEVLETTASFFEVLGVAPARGRFYTEAEELPGAAPAVVLSDRFWRRRFAADPGVVGGTVVLDGAAHTVIGIAPAPLRYPLSGVGVAAFLPHRPPSWASGRGSHYLLVLAKRRADVSLERARMQLDQIAARIASEPGSAHAGRGIQMRALADQVRGPVRQPLLLLFGAVGVVLAIACANLIGLALARASARRRDVSIRAALGASRAQLAREFLAESALLAVGGCVAGALLAHAILVGVRTYAEATLPRLGTLELDGPVFLFLLALAAASAILFGLVPAWMVSRDALGRDLVETSARATGGRERKRTRQALVATQLALSVTLLVGAGLLIRSFFRLQATSPGFDRVGVLTLHLNPARTAYDDESVTPRLLAPLLERVRALPGVEAAGVVSLLPMQAWGFRTGYWIDGLERPRPGEEWHVETRAASPGAFEALGVPLRAGRLLTETDAPPPGVRDGPYVCVVNEAFVRRHFPDGRALERRVHFSEESYATIVGVVGDTRQAGLDREPMPELTTSYADRRNAGYFLFDTVLVVRTSLPPASLTPAVRAAVHAVDPAQPIHTVRTLGEVVHESLGERRFHLLLFAAFAAVAVALAGTGLYALISYLVAQRTREVGVRMALGATAGEIARWVMRDGLALAGAGVVVGLGGGWAASRLVASQLVGVHPLDAATWGAVIAFLVLVALAASYAPAARAARVDPIQVLRQE
jgi:predicted permease